MRQSMPVAPAAAPRRGRRSRRTFRRADAAPFPWRAEALERRLLLAFAPAGPEFAVNAGGGSGVSIGEPGVAMGASGDFVITWIRAGPTGLGVYAQPYSAAGQAR